ncbi:hypothetical protein GMES_2658 [Paraglaciecola mesophila KMM 241]|uniref:Uncharacterized protein n=1 Tax=Paraglaciecola mesophila KMM 241 TaxID=1128912 RepID=K6Z3K5_9ALTE|nr:hypothetical protein GMES_2658 [Paraglaciecola mesophila KMM 241]
MFPFKYRERSAESAGVFPLGELFNGVGITRVGSEPIKTKKPVNLRQSIKGLFALLNMLNKTGS